MSSILFNDLETQNNEYYGTKASPYCPDNYVVESGWRIDRANADGSTEVGAVESVRFSGLGEFAQALPSQWLSIPADAWLIVAHNAAYEISWYLTHARADFEAFLKRGGRVWDTMHAEYILSDQTSLYPSLDETAPKYGGTHKVDGIKILWEQGVLTSEIDPMLLHEYLCGPGGDVENTARVFYGQYAAAQEQGKMALLWERMDAVLAFAYCEFFGLYVNMPVAKQNQAEQEQRISELRTELDKLLPELPPTLEFNFGSDYHMSALVYGGSVKYRKRVPYDPPQYVKADYWKVDGELVLDTGAGAPDGAEVYKAGKNKGLPKLFREDTDELKLKWEDDLFRFPGLLSIQQLPQVVQEKYGERGEFRGARNLPCGTPVYSTSTDAMKGLAAQGFEFAKLVNELNSLEKDTSTYYIRAEYAKKEHAGKASVPEAVVAGEPREGGATQQEETRQTDVRFGLGGVDADAGDSAVQVSGLSEGSEGATRDSTGSAGVPGPLPRDWTGSGSPVSHLQQSTGDGGGQPGGSPALYKLPQVGVDGCTKVSGMLQYVIPQTADGSGIIHHRLNTCATVTGRLSGSNPNLQNLPRDGTSRVKQMFTSRFGAEGRIIEVDYSALEVVMGCVHTGDTKLLGLLQADTDMHCYRLAFQHQKSYEEVLELCHNQDGPDYKLWKQRRTDIKPPSFAAQYGATAKGIAFATGLSVDFCQEFLDNEAKLFPDSLKFRDVIRAEVERTGNLQGNLHREQMDDGTYKIYRRGYWTSPSGMRYSFRQKSQWKDGQQVMDYKATEMANYWCQGEAFGMMAVAFGMIVRHMIARDWYDGQVCLITNVHDAAYLDAANEVVGREVALAVKHIMETARERMLQLWPNYGILSQVPFPAQAEMGSSMYEKKHVE